MFTNNLQPKAQLKLSLEDFGGIIHLCDGKSPMYRLNAEFDNYQDTKLSQYPNKEKALQDLTQALSNTSCPPDRVFISDISDLHVSADWYPPIPLLFTDVEHYWMLINNFSKYIGTFDFTKGQFNTGVFADSPNELSEREEQFITTFGIGVQIMSKSRLDFYAQTKKYSPQKIEVVDAR
ncbi:hypothetical protein MKZ07_23180 [Paenibacillus sp. FSL P4-0338]|uniref:hypothetical protein n=1 Tax=Paenibacillus sp. FSL P4-0338 TaxID=2921635 RepID=UPI0030FCAB51